MANGESGAMGTAIEFRNVSYAAPRGRVVLDNVSLAIEEGTTRIRVGTALFGARTANGETA